MKQQFVPGRRSEMPTTVTFNWNRDAIFERVATAVQAGLEDAGSDAYDIWTGLAPVSDDPRTTGDLRRMFRAPVIAEQINMSLYMEAYARHAKFVELGTIKMGAQAPLRRTAGMVMPRVPMHIRAALMEL
jgi:hypothetical protein